MARTRNWLADILTRTGTRIFKALSRLEERGLKETSRLLKLSVLGGLVALIGVLSAQEPDEFAMCYEILLLPDAHITDVEVDPNPTNGTDSITIKAKATVCDTLTEDNVITGALCQTFTDSTVMTALDGKFDEPEELIEGHLSLKGLEPGTTWVWIAATVSKGALEDYAPVAESFKLFVTDAPDSTEKGKE